MSKITELREQQARITAQARAKFDEINKETPNERAAEIEREFDVMMAAVSTLEARCKRLEDLEKAEERANAGDNRRPQGENMSLRAGGGEGVESHAVLYRRAFAKIIAGHVQDDLSAEERTALRAGSSNAPELRVQVAGTPSAGGYTVPTELLKEIDIALIAGGPMYDGAITREMKTASGHVINLPTIDDTAKSAGAHTEGSGGTDDGTEDVILGQKSLEDYAYDTEWLRWSWKLESDSDFSWEGLLGQLLGERLARKANALLTTGTGVGQPNGIVTAAGLGKTTVGAAAVTADEVLDFTHSIDPAYRKSTKFGVMFNDATLLALRKLKDGNGDYLIRDAGDGQGRLAVGSVSLPYHINQDMVGMGAGNRFMVAGDFGRYFVRKVASPMLFVARERFAPNMGILGLMRLDGELANTAAVKYMRNA
jgi:HK97 family phage major capsid protein